MSDKRRQRLESIIRPLISIDEFSRNEAKERCSESSASYVTRTLGRLVVDGLLQLRSIEGEDRYRWVHERDRRDASGWIDRQIHGVQVKETPEQERPREKLIRNGAASLSNAELLAILIRVGVQNESAVVGAGKVANRFSQRVEALPRASADELKQISRAVTKSSYAQIMAGIELGRRVARSQADQNEDRFQITSTKEAIAYCGREFERLAADSVQEEFHIVTLDTKHTPIASHRITVGTLDASLVHPREVFRPAIRDAASAILLVHNHPSGDPTPSREDLQVTEQLTEAGQLLGINVLDHIVVARQRCLSIRESG